MSNTGQRLSLIEYLRAFNRKERFILLDKVCGEDTFHIDPTFKAQVEVELSLEPGAIPSSAFVAMDYHLDWIQIALHLSEAQSEGCRPRDPRSGKPSVEDVDVLIAFSHGGDVHLVLIEAKAADAGWDWKQLESKANRIREIFGDECAAVSRVLPHFILMSPRDPREGGKLDHHSMGWPEWMRREKRWLCLPLSDDLRKATRCDKEGKDAKDGCWLRLSKWDGSKWDGKNENWGKRSP